MARAGMRAKKIGCDGLMMRLNTRLIVAAVAGILSIPLGLLVRANSVDWSRDVVRHDGAMTITTHFDEARHAILQDVGAVFLGLGVLLIALLVMHWVAEAR